MHHGEREVNYSGSGKERERERKRRRRRFPWGDGSRLPEEPGPPSPPALLPKNGASRGDCRPPREPVLGRGKAPSPSLNCSARSNPESIILLFLAACRGQNFLTGPYASSGGPRTYHVGVCTAPSPVGLELPRAAAIRTSPPGLRPVRLHTNVRAVQRVGLG